MSLTDTAEYWNDIKRNYPYIGPNYYHIPGAKCGHRHLFQAKKLGDVNCRDCLKLIKNGYSHQLPEGKTDFRSKGEKKRQRKIEKESELRAKLGKCKCGKQRVKRMNKQTGVYFLACSGYPKCKITSSINE